MPDGIMLWKWDDRVGAEELGRFPKNLEMSGKTMMQLYSQHLYSAKSDLVSMFVGPLNIVSFWTGSTHNYFLTLLLRGNEVSEDYAEIIPDLLYYLIPYIENNTYESILPSIFQRCAEFPQTNPEQRRAILYANDVNRSILKLLSEEGCFYRDELKIWLEDLLKTTLFNFEMSIDQLGHSDLIRISTVRGIDGTYVFLLKNLICFRAPPLRFSQKELQSKTDKVSKKIKHKVRNFFKTYKPGEKDNVEIANFVRQTDYWIIIDFLRKTNADRNTLHKLKLHGVDKVMDLVNILIQKDIVDTVVDQNNEQIYFLKTDIVLEYISMRYLFKPIYQMHEEHKKADKLLLTYIATLKETYLALNR